MGNISLILLFVFLVVSACEKDDICVDGDTPLLIIRFYNATDSITLKSVASLRIIGIGNGEPLDTFTDRSSRDSVAIPLRINEPNTQFQIILNSDGEDNTETGNIDTLQFNYETKEVFISRACGFVANYEIDSNTLTTDTDNWIQGVEIINTAVTSQVNAHVKIFH
jgi:hypothetical protein